MKTTSERDAKSGVIILILDEETGEHINILKVSKDVRFLDETEGILAELKEKLDKEGIDTPELVKKAWKTNEEH